MSEEQEHEVLEQAAPELELEPEPETPPELLEPVPELEPVRIRIDPMPPVQVAGSTTPVAVLFGVDDAPPAPPPKRFDLFDALTGAKLNIHPQDAARPWCAPKLPELVLSEPFASALERDIDSNGTSHEAFISECRLSLARRGLTGCNVFMPPFDNGDAMQRRDGRMLFQVKVSQ